jgi:uncharacterized membrane protein
MKKGQLVWGIICLALAGLLMLTNLKLPEEDVVFMVGNTNLPYIPPVVLGVVGIVLLVTAFKHSAKVPEIVKHETVDQKKADLNKRLETIGWGCFLLMLGGFLFVPHLIVVGGVWSIGVGVIMLGLNIARYFTGIRLSGFTTFLGILSVLVGIAQLAGVQALGGAALFIILGAYLVLKPWFDRRKIFGKAEQS